MSYVNTLVAALVLFFPLSAAAALDPIPQTRLDADLRCRLGAYDLSAGARLVITGAGGSPRRLQYTLGDGRFGSLEERSDSSFSDGSHHFTFGSCESGSVIHRHAETESQGIRLKLREVMTQFKSNDSVLHGKLVLPARRHIRSAAVWIEGSNNNPSTDDSIWQYELARRGIASFVYDKRGTGASRGSPTSDFHLRADDTVAAINELRRLAPGIRRVGVIGGSQGGWVAPLTATKTSVDFVISAFAMAEGPIAQDQALVAQQIVDAGFGPAELALANDLTKITEKIVRSNLQDGFNDLDAFKSQHSDAPWLTAIQPRSYTGLFLRFSSAEIRAVGPSMAQGLSFDYEPLPVICSIKARQLWLLGGQDKQAPNANTLRILKDLQRLEKDVTVVVFPEADHGLIEKIEVNGKTVLAYSTGKFDIVADWIEQRKLPKKSHFLVMPARPER